MTLKQKPFEGLGDQLSNKKRVKRTYTAEFRKNVALYAETHSHRETAKIYDLPMGTVGHWSASAKKGELSEMEYANAPDADHSRAGEGDGGKVEAIVESIGKVEAVLITPEKTSPAIEELEFVAEGLRQELIILESSITILKRRL